VDKSDILTAMRFAERAEGGKQSPVWGMVTNDMNAAADKMNGNGSTASGATLEDAE